MPPTDLAPTPDLPTWLTWQPRPFPDANLLLISGREPALIDSGHTVVHPATFDLPIPRDWA